MMLVLLGAFFSAAIALGVCGLAWRVSKRERGSREKRSPFECGFDPKLRARVPFSVRFFLLAVIFLIFDVEIALLLPFPLVAVGAYREVALVAVGAFLVVLVGGLLHEWREGSLE